MRVHPERGLVDRLQLLRRGEPEHADVPVVDQRIAERVVLQVVLEDRAPGGARPPGAPRRLARLPAMMFRTTTSIFTISQRADQHVAVGQAADEVRRDALLLEELEEHLGRCGC